MIKVSGCLAWIGWLAFLGWGVAAQAQTAVVNVHVFCSDLKYPTHYFRILTPGGATTPEQGVSYGTYGDQSLSINAGSDTSFRVVEDDAPAGSAPFFYQSATNGQFWDGLGRPSPTGVGQVVIGWGQDPSAASPSSQQAVIRAHLYNGTSANQQFGLLWSPNGTYFTGVGDNFTVAAGGSLDVVRGYPQPWAPYGWVPGYVQFNMAYQNSPSLPVALGQVTDFGAFGYGMDPAVLASHVPDPNARTADPVDAATGDFARDERVLSVQGARPLELVLHFRSLDFGSDYDASLQGAPGLPRVTWPGQRVNAYHPLGTQAGLYASYDLSALHDALAANPDGSYTLTRPDQSRFVFGPAAGPGGRLPLTALYNPTGQPLMVTYTGGTAGSRGSVTITEPVSGQALTLTYDAQDRLVGASDPLGRRLLLQYQGASPTAPSQIQLLAP